MYEYLKSIYYWHKDVFNAMMHSLVISGVISVIVLIMCLLWMHYRNKITKRNIIHISVTILYGWFLYMLTIGCRVPSDVIRVSFKFKRYLDLENIALFVPCGFLLSGIKRRGIGENVLLSLAISTIIEFTQLLTKRGYFELMDIVFNSIGGFIGGVMYMVFKLIE